MPPPPNSEESSRNVFKECGAQKLKDGIDEFRASAQAPSAGPTGGRDREVSMGGSGRRGPLRFGVLFGGGGGFGVLFSCVSA